jgi:hypothetical protein
MKTCDLQWLKVYLSAAKSTDFDKRGFYGISADLKSGGKNMVFTQFWRYFSTN